MTVIPYSVTRVRGCINSCYTPDDGCKKCPKHVEWSRSEIKVTTQLHRVGLFNNDYVDVCRVLEKCQGENHRGNRNSLG